MSQSGSAAPSYGGVQQVGGRGLTPEPTGGNRGLIPEPRGGNRGLIPEPRRSYGQAMGDMGGQFNGGGGYQQPGQPGAMPPGPPGSWQPPRGAHMANRLRRRGR